MGEAMAAPKFSLSSIFVTVLVFTMVLSPMISTAAATRLPLQVRRPPICPACVCCKPPPPGSCCKQCCATPIETSSQNGSP
ncbi:uncharacterized protein LOC111013890 [Momordica charantia]|uniref:Uncharacterized protein LOC111013890 n=1 Tax=Momordica charantia TaxID=3673 RepID=A0A6J1CSH3_MOMCH|nr:uncharacterized protein LOC111013890 [Momordica charantia]